MRRERGNGEREEVKGTKKNDQGKGKKRKGYIELKGMRSGS